MATLTNILFGSGINQTGTGSRIWSNPGNILASDDTKATISNMDDGEITYELCAYAPQGVSAIADADTITEVQVTVERNSAQAGASRYCVDQMAKLIIASTPTGTDMKDAVTKWPTTDTSATYTFSGLSYTGAQFKSAFFGFALQGIVTNSGALFDIRVDYIYIPVVTYTVAGGGGSATKLLPLMGVGS